MNLNFNNKVVIVTGGTIGIGKVICRTFLENNAVVVFTSRHSDEGLKVENEFKKIFKDCMYVNCDASSEDDIKNLIKKTIDNYSKIDVLVNNAAVLVDKIMDECTADEFDFLYKVNLRGYFLTCKYAIQYLIKTKGNIVNNSSIVGEVGQYRKALYSATKGGITAFTKTIALDYAKYLVRANAVLPGVVYTKDIYEDIKRKNIDYSDEFINSLPKMQPLGRIMVTSEEVANTILFLASDLASGITGTAIVIDRGATLDLSPGMFEF